MVNVRYMVDDVEAAVAFYTTHLGFTLISKTLPAFADVARGDLRLLLSGPTSSAGRPMPDGRKPAPGGWNRIHLVVASTSVVCSGRLFGRPRGPERRIPSHRRESRTTARHSNTSRPGMATAGAPRSPS